MYNEFKYLYSCITCGKRFTNDCPCSKQAEDNSFGCKKYEKDDDRVETLFVKVFNKLVDEYPKSREFIADMTDEQFYHIKNILLTHSDINIEDYNIDTSNIIGKIVLTNVYYFENGIGKGGFTVACDVNEDMFDVEIGIVDVLIHDDAATDKIFQEILKED